VPVALSPTQPNIREAGRGGVGDHADGLQTGVLELGDLRGTCGAVRALDWLSFAVAAGS
jgi:hypothetical protein